MPPTRYEIKLVVNEVHLPRVRSWLRLHPACFTRAFPHRQINNIYFDTPELDSYSENLSGISLRRKLRLRWYGQNQRNITGTLELKCKQSLQGWKVSQPILSRLDLTGRSWQQIREQLRSELKSELLDYFDRYSWPVLMNAYQRNYYLSFDGKTRVTLDFGITSYDQRLSPLPNLHRAVLPSGNMVIEVKADRENQTFLSEVMGSLPLRVGKHSKYAIAMEAILG